MHELPAKITNKTNRTLKVFNKKFELKPGEDIRVAWGITELMRFVDEDICEEPGLKIIRTTSIGPEFWDQTAEIREAYNWRKL